MWSGSIRVASILGNNTDSSVQPSRTASAPFACISCIMLSSSARGFRKSKPAITDRIASSIVASCATLGVSVLTCTACKGFWYKSVRIVVGEAIIASCVICLACTSCTVFSISDAKVHRKCRRRAGSSKWAVLHAMTTVSCLPGIKTLQGAYNLYQSLFGF